MKHSCHADTLKLEFHNRPYAMLNIHKVEFVVWLVTQNGSPQSMKHETMRRASFSIATFLSTPHSGKKNNQQQHKPHKATLSYDFEN